MKRAPVALMLTLSFLAPAIPAAAETVLTIRAGENAIALSREEFAAIKTVNYSTTTDWTDGKTRFSGPLIRQVLETAGVDAASVETIHATAANDYTVEIPAADIAKYDVILATEMDGKRLTLRDKGPLWVVYPRDDHAELNDPEVNSRWIWQLVELKVE